MKRDDMRALELLRSLYVHGANVDLVDGGIRVSKYRIPDDQFADVRHLKDAVLALIRD